MNLLYELPVDSALDHLSLVLNATAMKQEFEQRLFQGDKTPGKKFLLKDCRIERIKYKPGKNCLVCYRLFVQDRESGQEQDQLLCGRIYPPGGSASRHIKAQKASLAPTPCTPPLLHFPDLNMVFWTFPNERKLHALPQLTHPEFLEKNIVRQLAGDRWGGSWKVEGMSHSIVHYVPEHTCSFRVEVRLRHQVTREAKPWVIFGKTYYDDEGVQTNETMRQLWASESRRTGRLGMAQPLKYYEPLNNFWQEGLPGEPLFNMDRTHPDFPAAIERSGAMIAALHNTPVTTSRCTRLPEAVSRLKEMETLLGASRPAIKLKVAHLANRLVRQADNLDTGTSATLHGDLHLKNILAAGDDVFLIDLDNVSRGAPQFDLGSFLAGMIYLTKLDGNDWDAFNHFTGRFFNSYLNHVPWTLSQADLNWHIAAALINERAFRCLTRLKPGRLELIDTLIDLAHSI
ncbi:MAG: aminoglycoside phosphotransferase family protein, partial [Nitrospinaceae bacterium]